MFDYVQRHVLLLQQTFQLSTYKFYDDDIEPLNVDSKERLDVFQANILQTCSYYFCCLIFNKNKQNKYMQTNPKQNKMYLG